MPVKVKCPGCEKVLNAPDKARGKALKCPNCETRIKIPAGGAAPGGAGAAKGSSSGGERPVAKKRPAAKKRPTGKRPGADDDDFLAGMDLRHAQDRNVRICPKCTAQVDNEDIDCPHCGVNIETGVLSDKERRKRQRLGPDPEEFWGRMWKDPWRFVMNHKGLLMKTALSWMILGAIVSFCANTQQWTIRRSIASMLEEATEETGVEITSTGVIIRPPDDGRIEFNGTRYTRANHGEQYALPPIEVLAAMKPPAIFWSFMSTVFYLGIFGWYLFLAIEVIQLTMGGKNKFKRLNGDMFTSIALGIRFFFWPTFLMFPFLLLVAVATAFTGNPIIVALSVMAVSMMGWLTFPIATIHMAQQYTYKAWLFPEMAKLFFRNIGTVLYFWVVWIAVWLPFVLVTGGLAVGLGFLVQRLGNRSPAEVAGEWLNANSIGFEMEFMKYTLFEGPCAFVFAFLALIPLALVGAFSALFMCRANGLLGLYFGDRMELVNEQIGGVPVGFGPRYVAFLTDLTMVPLTSFLIVKNRTAMMVIWLCNALILVVVIFDPGPLYLMLVGCLNIGVTFWMYHCLMEAGYEQCTIGKNALGIIVVAAGTKASRISMKQGTIRFLGKIVSMLILGGGYLMVLFDKNKQTLHDKMAGTQVVWRGDESKM